MLGVTTGCVFKEQHAAALGSQGPYAPERPGSSSHCPIERDVSDSLIKSLFWSKFFKLGPKSLITETEGSTMAFGHL